MASPLGHSLMGAAVGRLSGAESARARWSWYAFAVIAANIPDFDILPGLLIGDINRFHHQASHSLFAAAAFGLLVALAARYVTRSPLRIGLSAGLLYASHLLLDYFSADGRPPHGIPLLWPFTSAHFIAPVTPLRGVKHGDPGEPLATAIESFLSAHNIGVVAIETLLLLPVLVAAFYLPTVLSWLGYRGSRQTGT